MPVDRASVVQDQVKTFPQTQSEATLGYDLNPQTNVWESGVGYKLLMALKDIQNTLNDLLIEQRVMNAQLAAGLSTLDSPESLRQDFSNSLS